jgi:hypothetical protein
MPRRAFHAIVIISMVLVAGTEAGAIINQVDGTVVPEEGRLQQCLDDSEGPGALSAIYDAGIQPEVYLPPAGVTIHFLDLAEGGGYRNSFGWYNVGDDVSDPDNLHTIFGCRSYGQCDCPCDTHRSEDIDISGDADYKGGYIGFWLRTPELLTGGGAGDNCGAADDTDQRIYFTEKILNDDGDYVHFLVYTSVVTEDAFYFGFEDLWRGGDNDFEDMLVYIEGLVPACIPRPEQCNGLDDDCDGIPDDNLTVPCSSECGSGVITCTDGDWGECDAPEPGGEVCDGDDNDCDGQIDEGLTQACSTSCGTGTEYCIDGDWVDCDAGTPTPEVCNGLDDDCDGTPDDGNPGGGATCGTDVGQCEFGTETCLSGAIMCAGGVDPTAEVCNGLDDDCDGTADDGDPGGGVACGTDEGECTAGITACVGGVIECTGEVGPTAEKCNGLDDDCDGDVDEGNPEGGMVCGTDEGECTAGVLTCMGGSLVCFGEVPPEDEECNGLDDDCDGEIDDGNPDGGAVCGPELLDGIGICQTGIETCVTTGPGSASLECVGAVEPTSEECNGLDDDCDGTVDDGDPGGGASCGTDTGECEAGMEHCVDGTIQCVGGEGPATEICDGLDNDCDGTVDDGDPGGGASCGMDVGECRSGTVSCVGGSLVCAGGVEPAAEECNGLDDDCDGDVDDGNPEGGDLCGPVDLDGVGICEAGVTTCVTTAPGEASVQCLGAVYPDPEETCNGLDDDCDGLVDNGIAGGDACGSDVGECVAGQLECVDGEWICDGEVAPTDEVCDGLDNDCDGETDEANPGGGESCGTDVGECEPGITYCDTDLDPPDIVCLDEVGPEDEICDGLDNDCNHLVDDGLPLDEPCGTDVGICELGTWICLDGELVCHGGISPTDELCNGLDDDCDGEADNEAECPGESICVEGYCASPCDPDDEWPCPTGRSCEEVDEHTGTYCVDDECEGVECDPGHVCRDGECVSLCEFTTCPDGWTCVIEDGDAECRPDDCYVDGNECEEGDRCVGGECEEDPCWDVTCGPEQFCREGECFDSCGPDVECADDETCRDGTCVPDPCYDVECEVGWVCDPDQGICNEDPCEDVSCREPLVCRDGECVDDPCSYITCPDGYVCVDATCVHGSLVPEPDAGADAYTDVAAIEHIAATGTGGCVGCTLAASRGERSGGPLAAAVLLALAALALAGRSRLRRLVLPLAVLAAAAIAAACETTPYCLGDDCEAAADGTVDGDAPDAAADTAEETDAPADVEQDGDAADAPDACTPGAEEECNGLDDDCDGLVDEDFDLDSDPANCGECGHRCELPHAYVSCVDGECVIDPERGCDVNYIDCLEDDPGDPETMGCETYCIRTRDDDTFCDGYDNDCDCAVDEDIDLTSDVDNCGQCGVRCRFYNAVPGCESDTGLAEDAHCVLVSCLEGFHDVDEDTENGCEYGCTACERTVGACEEGLTCCTAEGDETCNGLDDNCDGDIDEDDPQGGASCGTDEGECTAGTEHCVDGALACVGGVEPAAEECNGLDDDCDGEVDEPDDGEIALPDEGVPCGSTMGDCERGLTVCVDGALDCQGDVEPVDEVCDGHDNDCNGLIDDGDIPGLGDPCGTDEGECVSGTLSCIGGVPVCSGAVEPTSEECNGLDDDCDGETDEDVPGAGATCGTDVGVCDTGVLACVGGAMVCEGEVPPSQEECNGADDDCDGETDEGDPGGGASCGETRGTCSAGTKHCVSGSVECVGAVGPDTEECDGLDNDCDGEVDEGSLPVVGDPCGTDTGECVAGAMACLSGTLVCVGAVEASTEVCNDLDDDCDGETDEGDPGGGGPCGTNVGECTAGVLHCVSGDLVCQGEVGPGVEVCNDLDDDCDGVVDDGNPGGGGSCGTDEGECSTGTLNCVSGVLTCEGATGPSAEECNGADDDCDGEIDEGDPGGGVRCGTNVGECSYGTTVCSGGSLLCPDADEPEAEECDGLDNDCDAVVDEEVTPPVGYCDSGGVCTGTTPDCEDGGWVCNYPADHQTSESWCDGLDNDCDGTVDEDCPSLAALDVWLDSDTDNTISHDLATDGSLGVHVAYMDRRNGAADVFYRGSADGGTTWPDPDRRLDTDTAGEDASLSPAIAAGWGDWVVAAWGDFRDDQDERNIYSSFSDDAGSSWASSDERIDDGLDGDCFGVDVAMDVLGGVYAVFEYVEADRSRRIYLARSDDGGATFDAPVRLDHNSGPTPQIASDAHVAVDGSGGVFVVWRDNRNGTGDIYLNRSLDSGVTWSGTDTRLDSAGGYSDRPRIAASSTGAVYVTFEDDRNGSVDVYAACSQDRGASFGADTQLDTDVFANDSLNPSVAALDGTDTAWVVWEDYRDGLPDTRLSMTVDAGASWPSADVKVNADAAGVNGATKPDVAGSDVAGSAVVTVVWEDDRNGAQDIYMNFSLDGGVTFQPVDWRVDTDTENRDSHQPIVEAADGRFHIVWLDYRNAPHYNGDVYYRLFM